MAGRRDSELRACGKRAGQQGPRGIVSQSKVVVVTQSGGNVHSALKVITFLCLQAGRLKDGNETLRSRFIKYVGRCAVSYGMIGCSAVGLFPSSL